MDDDLDLLDGEGDTGAGSDEDGGDAGDGAPPADQRKSTDSKESKRVSDLMGKWQGEQAKNKRLQAELDALKAGDGKTDGGAQVPPEVQAWMDAAKDAARDRFYNADPRFAEYGLDLALIEGDSPDDMKASQKRLRDLIDAIESKARDRVLAEHGIAPDFVGSTREQPKDFASMSDDEFEKEVRRHTGY